MKFIKEKLREEEELSVNIPKKKDIKLNFLKYPELLNDPIAEARFTPPRTTFSLERSSSSPRLSKMTDSSKKNDFLNAIKPTSQENSTEIVIQPKTIEEPTAQKIEDTIPKKNEDLIIKIEDQTPPMKIEQQTPTKNRPHTNYGLLPIKIEKEVELGAIKKSRRRGRNENRGS